MNQAIHNRIREIDETLSQLLPALTEAEQAIIAAHASRTIARRAVKKFSGTVRQARSTSLYPAAVTLRAAQLSVLKVQSKNLNVITQGFRTCQAAIKKLEEEKKKLLTEMNIIATSN